MTEAFRRIPGMNTFAIHLFIDAWPAGWMKSIMDVDRVPKHAWFAYRDALTPVAVQLRSDRSAGFSGQTLPVELWTACDLAAPPQGCRLDYEVTRGETIIAHGSVPAVVKECGPSPHGAIQLTLPDVADRENLTVAASLVDSDGHALHHTSLTLTVFSAADESGVSPALAGNNPRALSFLESLDLGGSTGKDEDVILITDVSHYLAAKEEIDRRVRTEPQPYFSRCPRGPTRSVTLRSPCTRQAWVPGILFPALPDIRWRTVFFPRTSSSGSTKDRATPRPSFTRFWMAKGGHRSSFPETADGAALGDRPPPPQREKTAWVYGAFAKSTYSTASGPIP